MALARCEKHPVKGRTKNYVTARLPIGYPASAVVCGISACTGNAKIFLTQEEEDNYQRGQKIFAFPSSAAKAKVQ